MYVKKVIFDPSEWFRIEEIQFLSWFIDSFISVQYKRYYHLTILLFEDCLTQKGFNYFY